ncbi:MAG: bacterioferritin [Myxococcota bacterium]
MKGNDKIIAFLNAQLTLELSAVDQYVIQAAMLENWGYQKLHARFAHEADDERAHVVRLVDRILYFDGTPDVTSRDPLAIGRDPKSMLENDLAHEIVVAKSLNRGMALCREVGDHGTRTLLEELLRDTEHDHILWLQRQLHLVHELGLERYLGEQM